jgi:GT2 family glycosyltransferase
MIESPISVAIPTYRREDVLLDTIKQILALDIQPAELLVIDQTSAHTQSVEQQLHALHKTGKIIWLRQSKASIPTAMNKALLTARSEIILFVDDDIEVVSELVAAHAKAHAQTDVALVAGQVIQSWQGECGLHEEPYVKGRSDDPDSFLFNSSRQCQIERFMGGNFSIKKDVALQLGGFDENFIKVAYRFEAEFASRFKAAGYTICFYPEASIRHLQVLTGGTRSFGDHLTTFFPFHAVGRYYYLLKVQNRSFLQRGIRILSGPFKAVTTKFHLSHPWWIPVTFLVECSGIAWAVLLSARGARLLSSGIKVE